MKFIRYINLSTIKIIKYTFFIKIDGIKLRNLI